MPSARSPDQTVASFSLPSDLLDVVNRVCVEKRMTRSQLLREALAEKLGDMGITLPVGITDASMRLSVAESPAKYTVKKTTKKKGKSKS